MELDISSMNKTIQTFKNSIHYIAIDFVRKSNNYVPCAHLIWNNYSIITYANIFIIEPARMNLLDYMIFIIKIQ